MTVVENIIAAIERLVLPKLTKIEGQLDATDLKIKNLREVMEEKFKAVDEKFKAVHQRFDSLEDKLALDRRITALEERPRPAATTEN